MTCTHCTAEVSNGLALCARCQRTLTAACVNVAAYYADVDRIQPGQRVKVRSAYRSSPPPATAPAHDPVSHATDHVDAIVVGWVRNLVDDRPTVPQPPRTVVAACGWLEAHVATIATLEWASECLREMLACERLLRRIVDQADTGWYAGVCGNEVGREEDDEGESVPVLCERNLYGSVGTSWVRCPECGRTWDAGFRREVMMREARGELAPVSVIARAVVGLLDSEPSVEKLANRIDQWVSRKRLTSMGVRVLADGKPHRVYRIGDVFDLLGVEVQATDEAAC
jgi:hypothetical protein